MEQSEYILIGGGEHARVVLDILLANPAKVKAIFDPKYSGKLFGVDQLGDYQPKLFPFALAIVAIGNNSTRRNAVTTVLHKFGRVFHSSAHISKYAQVGEGSVLFHNTIVQANSKIGKHVIINTGAQVDHDCEIEDFVHIAPGTILCGSVKVKEGAMVGAGATIIPGITIGSWSVIGAGAVVTQNVPDNAIVVGVPAREIKQQVHE